MLGGKETREEEVGGRLESRGEGEKRNWLSISSFGAEGGEGKRKENETFPMRPKKKKKKPD